MDNNHNQELYQVISDRITNSPQNRITFAEYMDLVLYHPQQGYYARKSTQIGAQGDFFTSPHLAQDFGQLLAKQFFQMWEILGKPNSFQLVEMGAGQGIIAADILTYWQQEEPEFWQVLEYIIIEKSPQMQVQQQKLLQPFCQKTQWLDWQDILDNQITGCCFSNELVDAFPVHQLIVKDGKIQEIYLTLSPENNNFIEIADMVSTSDILDYFQTLEININSYPEGYRTEVNLAALDWLKTVSNKLKSGYLLTIDYGYSATRYYHPNRSQGTLQCYYKHQYHNNPYLNLGNQDMTAHVNFTALEITGKSFDLQTVGFTQQGLFLMVLGLGERIANISQIEVQNAQQMQKVLQRRQALHQLIDPTGLGNFGVLIQSKGLTQSPQNPPLIGLTVP
ncbi:class I SAM-dependent methyltransferase [Merismopedia glauca]|nr:class I SAM-dependent methyltransferase [Merismopedia glauca]